MQASLGYRRGFRMYRSFGVWGVRFFRFLGALGFRVYRSLGV